MSEDFDPATRRGPGGPRVVPVVVAAVAAVAGMVVIAMVTGVMSLVTGWLPSLNPFKDEAVDRTGPSVLKSLSDLSEYHAASAHYETVVDLEEGTSYLPGFVSGERVLYVGKGDVDAVVDFGQLDEERVELSEDGTSVTIRLPAPIADRPVLDLDTSYVADHDQGLVNRFRGSDLEREAQLTAVEQMSTASTGEGMLVDRAKENTTQMLRGLLGALGYTDITVTFDEDPR